MINVEEFVKVINYRITSGSEHYWDCFGLNSRYLNSEDEHYSASIVFDADTQVVYQATIVDTFKDRPYRITHPEYIESYKREALDRGIEYDKAYDDVSWIDLEDKQDWLEKAKAIVGKQEYDSRVSISLNLPDNEAYLLMKVAHERDITFNALIEEVLRKACKLKDYPL